MTLGQLKAQLRAGVDPSEIGEYLGEGKFRTAYKVGPFVVKAADTWGLKDEYGTVPGLRFAPTVTVRGWHIQLLYEKHDGKTPARWLNYGDLHSRNIGKDRRGRYVAFDW